MWKSFTATQKAVVVIATLLASFLFGVAGLLAGAWYGGNFRSSFEFNGVRGYEAFGQIGLATGAIFGGLFGCWLAIAVVRAWRSMRQ